MFINLLKFSLAENVVGQKHGFVCIICGSFKKVFVYVAHNLAESFTIHFKAASYPFVHFACACGLAPVVDALLCSLDAIVISNHFDRISLRIKHLFFSGLLTVIGNFWLCTH